MKIQYRTRPITADEIAAAFIRELPLEDRLQAAVVWNERKQNVAKQLKIESEAANLLNQGLMRLETDRVEIVAQMKRAAQEVKDAEKRFGEWQVKLAAHDKIAARFMPKPKGKPKAKRKPKAKLTDDQKIAAIAAHMDEHATVFMDEHVPAEAAK